MCVRTGIQAMRAKAISPGPEKKNKQARHACVRGVMRAAAAALPPFCMETPRELFGAFPSREGVPSCR